MVTSLKRVQTPLDDARSRRLDAIVGHDREYLMAVATVLGTEVPLPTTQAGVAGVLLSGLLDRVEQEVLQQRLEAHYRLMFPGGQDDPEDADGLATDRALAAASASFHGDFTPATGLKDTVPDAAAGPGGPE